MAAPIFIQYSMLVDVYEKVVKLSPLKLSIVDERLDVFIVEYSSLAEFESEVKRFGTTIRWSELSKV